MVSPTITCDPEVDALEARFSDNDIVETLERSELVCVDVDVDGVRVGLAVLEATSKLMPESSAMPEVAAMKGLMRKDAA